MSPLDISTLSGLVVGGVVQTVDMGSDNCRLEPLVSLAAVKSCCSFSGKHLKKMSVIQIYIFFYLTQISLY